MKNQPPDKRFRRKEELFRQLREISQRLAEQAPGLVHTPEDLNAMREERMSELVRQMREERA